MLCTITRRVRKQETDLNGALKVNFWYLKIKPGVHNFVKWAHFLEIRAI